MKVLLAKTILYTFGFGVFALVAYIDWRAALTMVGLCVVAALLTWAVYTLVEAGYL